MQINGNELMQRGVGIIIPATFHTCFDLVCIKWQDLLFSDCLTFDHATPGTLVNF